MMNGNLEEAKRLLKRLLDYLPRALKDIQQAYQAQDLQTLLMRVHKLHGACCYCAVPLLKQVVKDLEKALHQQQAAVVPALFLALEQQVKTLLESACHYQQLHRSDEF